MGGAPRICRTKSTSRPFGRGFEDWLFFGGYPGAARPFPQILPEHHRMPRSRHVPKWIATPGEDAVSLKYEH